MKFETWQTKILNVLSDINALKLLLFEIFFLFSCLLKGLVAMQLFLTKYNRNVTILNITI